MEAAGISFARRLTELATAVPDAPCISLGSCTLSRQVFDQNANRIASALAARGLAVGDLLTIALPNSIAFFEVAAACWKIGATPQPVSWRFPQLELDAIARLAETPFVVGEAGLNCSYPVVPPQLLLQEGANAPDIEERVAPSWKAATSGGSTGRPKLILSSQPGIFTDNFGAVWRLEADDVALMPAPLSHNGPFMTGSYCLLRGGHLVLMERFDAEEVLREIERRRATWVYLVPTMMSRIQRLPDARRTAYDLSTLRSVWHLAAPCPPWLKRAWIEWLGPDVIWEIYGATEALASTIISGSEYLAKPGSVGRVFMGEMKVVGPQGEDLSPGAVGEIYMRRGAAEPAPYRYRGAESKRIAQGWETVGDLGMIDADGYVFLSDRRTDMILVGGSNVYPAEVEAALEEHPAVQSCAVVGLPDADLGQYVHAIVEPRLAVKVDELLAHLGQRLVSYKLPRSIEFVTQSLRDEAGKVRRTQLRDERLGNPVSLAPRDCGAPVLGESDGQG